MSLDNQSVVDFQKLYLQEYQVKLNEAEAVQYCNKLICLVKAVYGKQLPDLKTIDNVSNQIQN